MSSIKKKNIFLDEVTICDHKYGMNNKDPYEKEKQQLDEALNLVGYKLRKQSLEYSEFKRLKGLNDSLIAAINTAITEWPSNQASIYLDGIMKNFSK